MNIGYGAPRQLLHRDDNVHHVRHEYREWEWGWGEVSQFGCLIAGCDVSREMGATMFVKGSHRWGDERWAEVDHEKGEVCFAGMSITPFSLSSFSCRAVIDWSSVRFWLILMLVGMARDESRLGIDIPCLGVPWGRT